MAAPALGRSGSGVQASAQDLAVVLDHFDVRRGVVAHSTSARHAGNPAVKEVP